MRGWERCSQSLGRGGVAGFRCGLEVGGNSLTFSFSAYLAALKGVVESGERRIHHHRHHGV